MLYRRVAACLDVPLRTAAHSSIAGVGVVEVGLVVDMIVPAKVGWVKLGDLDVVDEDVERDGSEAT